jgi:hypothetical protein
LKFDDRQNLRRLAFFDNLTFLEFSNRRNEPQRRTYEKGMTSLAKSWIVRICLGFVYFWLVLVVAYMLSFGLSFIATPLFMAFRAAGLPVSDRAVEIVSWIVLVVSLVCSVGLWWILWKRFTVSGRSQPLEEK